MSNRQPGTGEGAAHDHTACLHAKEEAALALLQRREPSPDVLTHLDVCPPCKDEYVELAALPRLLGAARETLAAAPPEPPRPQLLDRLLAEVDRRRRRRRMIGVLAAAAVSAAAAVAAVAAISLGARPGALIGPGPSTGGPIAVATSPSVPGGSPRPTVTTLSGAPVVASGSAADPASGADAHVDVREEGVGSVVSVSVHGWPTDKPCRMVVHDTAGQAREVGIFTVDALDESTYVEEVDLPPARIQRIELVDDRTGRAMIDVRVRSA